MKKFNFYRSDFALLDSLFRCSSFDLFIRFLKFAETKEQVKHISSITISYEVDSYSTD